MKTIKQIFFGALLLATITVIASSCKKEEHNNSAPVITINEPTANATVLMPGPVHIEGTMTDDDALHEARVLAIQSTGDTVFSAYPVVHAKTSHQIHYHFAPPATGVYTIEVTAVDHDGQQAKITRSITVM